MPGSTNSDTWTVSWTNGYSPRTFTTVRPLQQFCDLCSAFRACTRVPRPHDAPSRCAAAIRLFHSVRHCEPSTRACWERTRDSRVPARFSAASDAAADERACVRRADFVDPDAARFSGATEAPSDLDDHPRRDSIPAEPVASRAGSRRGWAERHGGAPQPGRQDGRAHVSPAGSAT